MPVYKSIKHYVWGYLGISFSIIIIQFFWNIFPLFYFIIMFGLWSGTAAVLLFRSMFTLLKIQTKNSVLYLSPDLTVVREKQIGEVVEIPNEAICAECHKSIFKPFQCKMCGKLLCGVHYLLGEHLCVDSESD